MNSINSFRLFIQIIFLLICLLNKFVNKVCGQSSQTENDLNYLMDETSNSQALSSIIRFTPESLHFHQHSIGIPYVERVLVENLQNDHNIQMLSISGNTVHFHCSFFEDKLIQGKGNTSFEVVFLARHEGHVNNTLYIHTSLGSFKYRVTAIGVSNPFRLRPFIGAKVPINSSYAPLIHIYNPHSSTLQLTEMYTTGGGLHLELPTGDPEGPQELWQIAPFETKTIMRANFLARSEKNHTAYIRIKTNSTDQHFVILPVEVEVSSAPGIYSPIDLLDFGVMRTHDEPRTIAIQILNSGSKHIQIQNVIATPVNEALSIDFSAPVKVSPNIFHAIDIARVTLMPKKITHCNKQCNGKIVVKSKNNQYKLAIPYQVLLLQGYLSYNETQTQFYIESSNSAQEKRILVIHNKFNLTVVIHSVSLPDEAKPYFKVVLVSRTVTLAEDAKDPVLKITFTPSSQLSHMETTFRLNTNLSYFDVPLRAYSGKLDVFIPQSLNQTVLDFGAIGLGEKKSMTFAVINNNPVIVKLKHWGCNMSKAYVELMGIAEGNATVISHKLDFSNLSKKQVTILKPKHYAIFALHLTGFSEEGDYFGETFVETPFERLSIPFVLRAVEGSFVSEKITISNCFPSRISSQSVRLTSYFTYDLKYKSASIVPKDERFSFDLNEPIVNYGENLIGKLYFDPVKRCAKMCYSGLDTSKEVGHLWLLGIGLHPDTGYIDKELHKLLYSRWTNLQENDKSINVTLQLEIDGVSPVSIGAQAQLQWPRLVHRNLLKFPITRVGNSTVKEIIMENPSSQLILVQVVLLSDYPNPDVILQLLKSGFHTQWSESELNSAETKPKSFHLTNISSAESVSNRKNIKETIGVNPDSNSLTFLMPIGSRKKISIGFSPKDDSALVSTILLIRNNLTIIDAIYLQGQGGSGILKIGNQLSGSKSILSFELLEKHLKSCSKSKPTSQSSTTNSYSIEPTFTVHRTFTAVNVGKLSMKIKGFAIGPQTGGNQLNCQGFGFKVINCAGFDLRPNENRKIHIAFTPDFTQYKTKQMLTIITDNPNEKIQYALIATLPKHLLPVCNNSLPRPNWEAVLYYCLVTMMTFMILLAICVAFFDGDRILNFSFYPVLTTYAYTSFDSNRDQDLTDKLFPKFSSNTINDESKDSKRNTELRNRKVKCKGSRSNSSNTREDLNSDLNTNGIYAGQSWTQFLRKKFVRRDSSGSDKSNNSNRCSLQTNLSKSQSLQQMSSENVKKESVISDRVVSKSKLKKSQKSETESNKNSKKKLTYQTKQENLTNVISSPPPPLPIFPSAFDEESFLKNIKSNKKSRTNSFHNETGHSSLELPYKPKSNCINTNINNNNNNSTIIKPLKKMRNKEEVGLDDNESYNSSNENSIIWDSPINTFDSDNAMNELVRQTELFAEKSNSSSFPMTSRVKSNEQIMHSNVSNRDSLLPTNWTTLRSSTPPAKISQHLIEDSLLERRTPPIGFSQPMERSIPSNPWLTDLNNGNVNSLDHELTHLRETSSPWNSHNYNNSQPTQPSQPSQSTQQRNWNYFGGLESTKDLWSSSKWSSQSNSSTLTSTTSQSPWNDSFNPSLWHSKANDTNTWQFPTTTENVSDLANNDSNPLNSSSAHSVDSSFNLFGRSLWSPLSGNTNTANSTISVTKTTTEASSSSTTWSFTPFTLFGSQTQFNSNNDRT